MSFFTNMDPTARSVLVAAVVSMVVVFIGVWAGLKVWNKGHPKG